jgi:hypothetical protein
LVPAGTPVLLGPGLPPLDGGAGGADEEPDECVGGGATIEVLGGAGFDLVTGAERLDGAEETTVRGRSLDGVTDEELPATGFRWCRPWWECTANNEPQMARISARIPAALKRPPGERNGTKLESTPDTGLLRPLVPASGARVSRRPAQRHTL